MQIISSRQYLFEREEYKAAPDTDDKKDLRHRHVEETILVRALQQPQVVPAWVGETDLFKVAVKDGTIVAVELAGATPVFGVNNESKAGFKGAAAPVAQLAAGAAAQPTQQTDKAGGWGTGRPQ